MVLIRPMEVKDIDSINACNRRNLPENYQYMFLMYVLVTSQEACFVAENNAGEVVGYVIAKTADFLEERELQDRKASGYIASIAVDKMYRRQGIGKMLMCVALHGLCSLLQKNNAGLKECTVYLNVRESNKAAIVVYEKVFGFILQKIEESYYPDKENAFLMQKVFPI